MVFALTPHLESQKLKAFMLTDEKIKVQWIRKWSWILDEYKALRQELNDVSEKYPSQAFKEEPDPRMKNLRFPETHNQMYGRLATRKEFSLENYGPDVLKPIKIYEY